ncbi:MAG: SCO family protein [Ignavibacteria bacterium]|nr:SCO family protein [Ignavibacteria bacterium]
MKKILLLTIIISAAILFGEPAKKSPVGIDEQLGKMLPTGLRVTDEQGNLVEFDKLIDKPTILMFVYYECPGLCSPLLSEVADEISKIDLKPGTDYRIITVSFDPSEKSELALKKKKNYLSTAGIAVPDDGWRFLTADSNTIAQLTDATGFRYKKEGDEYIHAGALIIVSPTGKITRYLLGTDFLPFDMKMALIEASSGTVSPTIAKVLKYCFKYDPEGRKYVLNVTRIAGTAIIMMTLVFVGYLTVGRKKKEKINEQR